MRSKFTAVLLVPALALGVAACGDDGDSDEATSEATSEAAGETTTTTEAGLGTEACDAVLGMGVALTSGPDGPPTPEYLEGTVVPAVEAVVASGAEELTGPAEDLQAAVDTALDGGEVDEAVVFGAYGEMSAVAHTGCGFETVDTVAVDYAFEGLPTTTPTGTTSFALTNEGTEEHEIVIFRRADGEERPIEELLALGEEEVGDAVVFTGVAFAGPGETAYTAVDLEAGGYAVVCFLPVGGAEDGPPHFTEGMVAEFEVA